MVRFIGSVGFLLLAFWYVWLPAYYFAIWAERGSAKRRSVSFYRSLRFQGILLLQVFAPVVGVCCYPMLPGSTAYDGLFLNVNERMIFTAAFTASLCAGTLLVGIAMLARHSNKE